MGCRAGSALDAGDVVYSIKRVIDPDYGSPARAAVKMIEHIEATGPLTVRMRLESTFAEFAEQSQTLYEPLITERDRYILSS